MHITGTNESIMSLYKILKSNKDVEIGFRSGNDQHVVKCATLIVSVKLAPHERAVIEMNLTELIDLDQTSQD